MNRLPFSRIALLAALGLLAPSTWAQTELVAFHPCVIEAPKPKRQQAPQTQQAPQPQPDELKALCDTAIAGSNVQLVASEQVNDFLAKEPAHSCAFKEPGDACDEKYKPTHNACLGKLATATKASHALLITRPSSSACVYSVLVDPSGKVLDHKRVRLRDNTSKSFGTTVPRLLKQIPLPPAKVATREPPPAQADTLTPREPPPVEPTPAPAPPTVAAAPPPAAPPPAAAAAPGLDLSFLAGRSWKTPTAYATAGAGLVALGLATAFTVQAGSTLRELDAPYADGNLPPYSELGRLSGLQRTLNTQRTVAGVSAAVGAALVGTGVYLWLSDRPQPGAPATPGATALSAGPGGVNVRVTLP